MKRFAEMLDRTLQVLLAGSLLLIAVTVVVQVALSSVFNSSITGANELITKLFVYVTAIGAAVAPAHDDHISITVLSERFSPSLQKVARAARLLLVAMLNGIVVAYSVHWIRVTGHYVMPITQLPRMVAQLSIPLGASLAVLFCMVRLWTGIDPENLRPNPSTAESQE